MAKFTVKLYQFERDPNFNLFDFEYPFYGGEEEKKQFESLFWERNFNKEIGFETIGLFKRYLKSKLFLNYERWKMYYYIEQEANKQNYLYNKDLKEETIREVNGEVVSNQSNNSSSNSKSSDKSNTTSDYKGSDINNGLARIDLNTSLTSASLNNDSSSNNSDSSTSTNGELNSNENSNTTEKITFISQGNIGVTTGADLKNSWIDSVKPTVEYVLEELDSLFMQVF